MKRAHERTASSRCGDTMTTRSSSPGVGSPHCRIGKSSSRTRFGSAATFTLEPMAEEPALRTGVCVVVIGNVPHVVVDVMLELEVLGDDPRESVVHVRELV